MSEQEEKIVQFTGITGVAEDRAKFYLDSSGWQVDVALARYYENDGEDVEIVEEVESLPRRTEEMDISETTPSPAGARPKPKSKGTNAKFATLNTLASSDEDEEEGQAFYAGGSEHSGQQVLGPNKKKDIVSDMFRSVKARGVETVHKPTTSNSRFKGTGYKLGETENDSVTVPGHSTGSSHAEVTLKLWRDGFTINDGDLREYTDPQNRELLDSIRRGEIPAELRTEGSEMHLSMEDHRMEVFKTAPKKLRTFTGTGHTLGNVAPPVVGACRDEDKPLNEASAKENLKLDTTQPTTSLQIRLADGSRLVAQFNHAHTVGEIRNYILAARPQYTTQNFNLITSYPSKILDDCQTIVDAGLLNAAIMQKLV